MRAIDADAFDERVRVAGGMSEEELTEDFKDGVQAVLYMLSNQPTIQPEPHWIPVTERLPEEPFGCFVTVMDTNPMTMEEFENILPYFVGWDGEQWNDADGEQCPFEVIAWWGLPEPYKGVTE